MNQRAVFLGLQGMTDEDLKGVLISKVLTSELKPSLNALNVSAASRTVRTCSSL